MLTNEKIAAIHANAVAHGFWEAGNEPTFGEYCALIHEEISEAFSAWRNGEPDEYVVDGKPEGVLVELADVVIRIGDLFGAMEAELHSDESEFIEYCSDIRQAVVDEPNLSFAEFSAMLHSFVSEYRANKSEHNAIELLTAVICIYVRAELENIDLDAIIERKCAYNATRPWRHGKRM